LLGVTNRFARDSQEAIDEEAAPAHLVTIAEGIDIALGSLGRPVLHLPQPPLRCQQLRQPPQPRQQVVVVSQGGIRRHNALTGQAKAEQAQRFGVGGYQRIEAVLVERWKIVNVPQQCLARFDEVIVSVRVRQRRPYWRATYRRGQQGQKDRYGSERKGEQE
jgi:hypothetical protein